MEKFEGKIEEFVDLCEGLKGLKFYSKELFQGMVKEHCGFKDVLDFEKNNQKV